MSCGNRQVDCGGSTLRSTCQDDYESHTTQKQSLGTFEINDKRDRIAFTFLIDTRINDERGNRTKIGSRLRSTRRDDYESHSTRKLV